MSGPAAVWLATCTLWSPRIGCKNSINRTALLWFHLAKWLTASIYYVSHSSSSKSPCYNMIIFIDQSSTNLHNMIIFEWLIRTLTSFVFVRNVCKIAARDPHLVQNFVWRGHPSSSLSCLQNDNPHRNVGGVLSEAQVALCRDLVDFSVFVAESKRYLKKLIEASFGTEVQIRDTTVPQRSSNVKCRWDKMSEEGH